MVEEARVQRIDGFHWAVETSIPSDGNHRYAQNRSFDILCNSAQRAIDIVMEVEPTATIHSVRKVGKFATHCYVDAIIFHD